MAKKSSLHSGRCGSMIHNFDIRRENISGYDDRHIDRDISDLNIYVQNTDIKSSELHLIKNYFETLLKDDSFSGDLEAKETYAELYEEGLNTRNENYLKTGHKERVKSIDDWYKDDKYRARETIIQIGNHQDTPLDKDHIEDIKKVRDELQQCIEQYALEYSAQYGDNYKILNWTIHCDEIENGSIHAHLQDTFCVLDKDGHFTPNQNKALEQMGIELPNPEKKKSLHNSLIKSFTGQQRQRFTEICKEHGLDVEIYDASQLTENKDSKGKHQDTSHEQQQIAELQKHIQELKEQETKALDQFYSATKLLKQKQDDLVNAREELEDVQKAIKANSSVYDQKASELTEIKKEIQEKQFEASRIVSTAKEEASTIIFEANNEAMLIARETNDLINEALADASTKTDSYDTKMEMARLRRENEQLKEKISLFEDFKMRVEDFCVEHHLQVLVDICHELNKKFEALKPRRIKTHSQDIGR